MRYYLTIYNGIGMVEDEEGRDFASLAEAKAAAIDGIRSLISEEARQGTVDLTGRIEVLDSLGKLLCLVRYEEAIDLRLSKG
ncbi:hypothetical protein Q4F19_07215 [Sphingomonas sp. BIUV-7]|uniref:DUF6894 domain-containing protein n=1 Tax=Sphingomonas natans TaxID=3063330 RepID=A0ABT8Y764_9SPHN|nr:hypothetical protein [Sphingomonas sp. BIUV-7]MDO6414166.1 hypothetical protein [Sphingomonas sp. BIUV-7]